MQNNADVRTLFRSFCKSFTSTFVEPKYVRAEVDSKGRTVRVEINANFINIDLYIYVIIDL